MIESSKPMLVLLLGLSLLPKPVEAAAPTPTAPAIRADFHELYDRLQASHFSLFANQPKTAYDAKFQSMQATFRSAMSHRDVLLAFQRFVAYGDVAHATTSGLGDEFRKFVTAGGKRWPLAVEINDGRLSASYRQLGIPPQHEIVAIQGVPTAQVLEQMRAIVSADNSGLADSLLERGFALYAWLTFGYVEHFDLETQTPAGRRRHRIDALPQAAIAKLRTQAPASVDRLSRRALILPSGIAYLQPGPFLELDRPSAMYDSRAFVKFIDESFDQFLKAKAPSLIIDLRGNPGGDNSFSDPMIAWFATKPFAFASRFIVRSSEAARASNQARIDGNPSLANGLSGAMAKKYASTPCGQTFELELPQNSPRRGARFEGPVFVIVDRYSYSNAVNVAAMVQDYGFGTVVGEPTRDLATTFGAMESFTLSQTGIVVHFPKALIVRPSGSMTPAGVRPDVTLDMVPATARRDPVLERVEQMARAQTKSR